MKTKIQFFIVIITICSFSACTNSKKTPIDVALKLETVKRFGGRGDNWCITWASDGSQVTSMDDGDWLGTSKFTVYHSNLYRIVGEKDNFTAREIPGYPKFSLEGEGWFGFGVYDVNGTIYSMVSRTPRERWGIPFAGVKMLKSTDNGKNWVSVNSLGEERQIGPWDEVGKEADDKDNMFFVKEYGYLANGDTAYPFVFCSFVQNGKGNQAAKDEYVYVYSPEPLCYKLSLARVKKHLVGFRSEWEFFSGWENNLPTWTKDISKRKPAHIFPEKNNNNEYFGWYSWLPCVVWNKGLGMYIMVNGGTYAGKGLTNKAEDYYYSPMHSKTGSLGFWYSENPYGPWKQFYYNEYWTVDDEKNRTYQPKLSPKWISEDGTKMVLIWSDAMYDENGRSHNVNYTWNQMEIEIILK